MGAVKLAERFLQFDTVQSTVETPKFKMPFAFEVYSFGAQRMCNKPFQRWNRKLLYDVENCSAFRLVNDLDIIPTGPPNITGHHHGGGQLVFVDTNCGEGGLKERVSDHMMENYCGQIKGLATAGIDVVKSSLE